MQAVYADADDTSAHPVITLTKSHSGHLAKLTLEGTPLEKDFVVHDEFGDVLGGVGMVLHQEASWGIYVAQVTPGGPAAAAGCIEPDDVLVQVDSYLIEPSSTLDDIRRRFLGPPGSAIRIALQRPALASDLNGALGLYQVTLTRATPSYLRKKEPSTGNGGGLQTKTLLPGLSDGVLVEVTLLMDFAEVLQREAQVKMELQQDIAKALKTANNSILIRGLRPGHSPDAKLIICDLQIFNDTIGYKRRALDAALDLLSQIELTSSALLQGQYTGTAVLVRMFDSSVMRWQVAERNEIHNAEGFVNKKIDLGAVRSPAPVQVEERNETHDEEGFVSKKTAQGAVRSAAPIPQHRQEELSEAKKLAQINTILARWRNLSLGNALSTWLQDHKKKVTCKRILRRWTHQALSRAWFHWLHQVILMIKERYNEACTITMT